MKKLVLLITLSVSIASVNAASNIFESTNPFPQTMPQSLNNIYESEPAKLQQEEKQQKKSWFRKGKNLQEQDAQDRSLQTYPVNEGVNGTNDNNFFIFK